MVLQTINDGFLNGQWYFPRLIGPAFIASDISLGTRLGILGSRDNGYRVDMILVSIGHLQIRHGLCEISG